MKSYKVVRDREGRIKGMKKEPNRREFLKNTGLFSLAAFIVYSGLKTINIEDEESGSRREYLETIGKADTKNETLYENYEEIKKIWDKLHPEKDLEDKIIFEYNDKITEPRHTFKGRHLRTKRWENPIRKTEKKYNIPKFNLYALIMQESYGDPLIVNERDGGSGLGCLQPKIAKYYGLKTYKNADFMISKNYGKQLAELVKKYNYDLDKLKEIHEPFDPNKCIEAMGNFLFDLYKELGDWEKAIAAYNCGEGDVIRDNIPGITKKHVENINKYKEKLNIIKRFE